MNKTININIQLLFLSIPLVMLIGLIVLIKSPLFPINSDVLSLGITMDLLLSIPIIYFLIIRKTNISKTTIVPVMVAGLVIGTYFLPQSNQNYLDLFKTWAYPVIELLILAYLIVKVRSVLQKHKDFKKFSPDFFTTLKDICYEILPKKLVLPFATEVAVLYYGFINWKSRTINKNEFTYHKKSGTLALLGAVISIIAIETFVLHILLSRWIEIVAWIISGLSIYTAIQVFGFAKSLTKRPIIILPDKLILRYGILNETEIRFDDIDSIELSRKPIIQDETSKKLSPLGELESHNVIIRLNEENTLTGLYGIKKKFKVLALHVDKEIEFKKKMENALQQKL